MRELRRRRWWCKIKVKASESKSRTQNLGLSPPPLPSPLTPCPRRLHGRGQSTQRRRARARRIATQCSGDHSGLDLLGVEYGEGGRAKKVRQTHPFYLLEEHGVVRRAVTTNNAANRPSLSFLFPLRFLFAPHRREGYGRGDGDDDRDRRDDRPQDPFHVPCSSSYPVRHGRTREGGKKEKLSRARNLSRGSLSLPARSGPSVHSAPKANRRTWPDGREALTNLIPGFQVRLHLD